MKTSEHQRQNKQNEENKIQKASSSTDAIEDGGKAVLDEVDLEENNLTPEEADEIERDKSEENAGNR